MQPRVRCVARRDHEVVNERDAWHKPPGHLISSVAVRRAGAVVLHSCMRIRWRRGGRMRGDRCRSDGSARVCSVNCDIGPGRHTLGRGRGSGVKAGMKVMIRAMNREEIRNEKTKRTRKPARNRARRGVEPATARPRRTTSAGPIPMYDRLNSVTVYHEKRLPNVLG